MLLTVSPLAGIDATIGPLERSLPLFNIVDEITLILPIVRPDQLPVAVHLIFDPGAEVFAPIRPDVLALAVNLVIQPLTHVHASIAPDVAALTVLVTFTVHAFVD